MVLLGTDRRHGEPDSKLRRGHPFAGARVVRPERAKNKRPHRGRRSARGNRSRAPKGPRESEGCKGAETSGNGVAPGPRPSKGGPSRCELQEGTMTRCLDIGAHVTGTQEGSGNERSGNPRDDFTRWRILSMCRRWGRPTTASARMRRRGWMGSRRSSTGRICRPTCRTCTSG